MPSLSSRYTEFVLKVGLLVCRTGKQSIRESENMIVADWPCDMQLLIFGNLESEKYLNIGSFEKVDSLLKSIYHICLHFPHKSTMIPT